MPVVIENGQYIVRTPELGLVQPFDPSTGNPWADQATAEAWEAGQIAAKAAGDATAAAVIDADLIARRTMELTLDKDWLAKTGSITVGATLKDRKGNVITGFNGAVGVIMLDTLGAVKHIKKLDFTAGICATTWSFAASGIYSFGGLTTRNINASADLRLRMGDEFTITVVEP